MKRRIDARPAADCSGGLACDCDAEALAQIVVIVDRLILAWSQMRAAGFPNGGAVRREPDRGPIDSDVHLYRLRDFLRITGLSYATYRKLRAEGKTPKEIRLSQRTIFIPRAEVIKWVARDARPQAAMSGKQPSTAKTKRLAGAALE